ncbi:MAG: putative selenium-dependent hydroxylase accessory protein YqeC [Candidatus Marinimicrobia bacterium]|nr:putative selenium-dependent hydroxylase accessory protein YqeC [Candidatus Neomarinimicrobiota bacterium]
MKFSKILFNTPTEAYDTCIGILGGGGKTALLHRLGDELSKYHPHVILSSLTKAGISKIHPVHFYPEFESEESRALLLENNPLYIMGEVEHEEKLLGLNEDQLRSIYHASDLTVFECDGARKRPIKAHQPFDPMIPGYATHAILVVGADAMGAKIDGKLVHRPELFRELWDVKANFELDARFIAKVLTSQYGYLQKVPSGVKVSYFVNKADSYPDQARQLAITIARFSNAPVFQGSLEAGYLEQII